MDTAHRRTTYRLYPTPAQEQALTAQLEAHRLLYNAALEQRRAAWSRQRVTLSYADQCRDLTPLRQSEDRPLPAQAAQSTLKRVQLAFEAFFRRLKAGQTPGYPRLKARRRFHGWTYPTHGDGWRLLPRDGMQHGRVRLAGVGHVRMRGDARTLGTPKTCTIVCRHGKWYASVVLACHPVRSHGTATMAFDWGVETFATLASLEETPQPVANPRFLGASEATLQAAYRARDRKRQCSHGWRLANRRVAQIHSTIARQRLDFHHKQAAAMIDSATVVITEQLHTANMSRRPKPKPDESTGQFLPNGAASKAGLNKAILDSAPTQFLGILRYKAAEAGVVYVEAPTRVLKPSQRCHACWTVAPKPLHQRWHICACGASCGRDENSARVLLVWGVRHILSVFLATVWLRQWSQELAPGLGLQNLPLEPKA